MNSSNTKCWVENLAWPEIENAIANGAVGVLPVGAASKEHGRHLPLNTDFRQAKWLAEQLADASNALIWPVVSYGYYPSFVDFPGSISVNDSLFAALVSEIVNGIFFAGVDRVIVLNTGISTIAPLQGVIENHRKGSRIILHNVYAGPMFSEAVNRIEEQDFGGHADEIETSIMLALDDSVVDLSLARAPAQSRALPISRGLFNRSNPEQANYSPDGVNGNPTLATKEKGKVLLEALRVDCLRHLVA